MVVTLSQYGNCRRTSLPEVPVRPAQQLKRDLITPMRDRLTTDLK